MKILFFLILLMGMLTSSNVFANSSCELNINRSDIMFQESEIKTIFSKTSKKTIKRKQILAIVICKEPKSIAIEILSKDKTNKENAILEKRIGKSKNGSMFSVYLYAQKEEPSSVNGRRTRVVASNSLIGLKNTNISSRSKKYLTSQNNNFISVTSKNSLEVGTRFKIPLILEIVGEPYNSFSALIKKERVIDVEEQIIFKLYEK